MKRCKHDYKNYKRIARAKYVCPKCHCDITFEVVMIAEMEAANDKHENKMYR